MFWFTDTNNITVINKSNNKSLNRYERSMTQTTVTPTPVVSYSASVLAKPVPIETEQTVKTATVSAIQKTDTKPVAKTQQTIESKTVPTPVWVETPAIVQPVVTGPLIIIIFFIGYWPW